MWVLTATSVLYLAGGSLLPLSRFGKFILPQARMPLAAMQSIATPNCCLKCLGSSPSLCCQLSGSPQYPRLPHESFPRWLFEKQMLPFVSLAHCCLRPSQQRSDGWFDVAPDAVRSPSTKQLYCLEGCTTQQVARCSSPSRRRRRRPPRRAASTPPDLPAWRAS